MPDFKPIKVNVSLRLPLDLVNKLKTEASAQDRSFNNLIERILKQIIETI